MSKNYKLVKISGIDTINRIKVEKTVVTSFYIQGMDWINILDI